MHYLSCIHPPGGATALAAVIGGDAIHQRRFHLLVLRHVAEPFPERPQIFFGQLHVLEALTRLRQATPAFERAMIEVALQHSQGRKRDAAELLGWGRNTLTRKMKELGM